MSVNFVQMMLCVLLLAGVYAVKNDDNFVGWPLFGRSATHTRVSPTNTGSVNTLKFKSQLTGTPGSNYSSGCLFSSPVIGADGLIYVGSYDASLYCFNSEGAIQWQFVTGGTILGSAAVGSDNIVYVGSSSQKFYAINPGGSQKWVFQTKYTIRSSPVLDEERKIVYFACDYILHALSMVTGELLWQSDEFPNGNSIYAAPAIGKDGNIYIGTDNDNVFAFNPEGKQLWNFNPKSPTPNTGPVGASSIAIGADGTLYRGAKRTTNVYAINPVSGALIWSYDTGYAMVSSPAIDKNGNVIIGSLVGPYVYSLSPAGKLVWRYQLSHQSAVAASPAISNDGYAFIACTNGNYQGYFEVITVADGKFVWNYPTNAAMSSSPAISATGDVVVGSTSDSMNRAYLFAFRAV